MNPPRDPNAGLRYRADDLAKIIDEAKKKMQEQRMAYLELKLRSPKEVLAEQISLLEDTLLLFDEQEQRRVALWIVRLKRRLKEAEVADRRDQEHLEQMEAIKDKLRPK